MVAVEAVEGDVSPPGTGSEGAASRDTWDEVYVDEIAAEGTPGRPIAAGRDEPAWVDPS